MKIVSIIAPCYNEESVVELFFEEISKFVGNIQGYDLEIIIVNDGSTDSSLQLLEKHAKENSNVTVIDLNRNFGKEIAISAGLDHATGDAAIVMDFDLQHPTSTIAEFIKLWESGYESVVGLRKDRKYEGFLKSKFSRLFYCIYNKFSDITIDSRSGDFRLIDRKIIDQLKTLPEKQRFMKGIFSWIGAKTAYIEYEVLNRRGGASKFSCWKLWNFAIEGITGFSTLPLRIWTYVGFIISFLAFSYGIYITIKTMILGIIVPGYSSIITLVLFLGGVQIMGIGIVGEYLGRVYMETKNRPLYLVRKLIKKDKVDDDII